MIQVLKGAGRIVLRGGNTRAASFISQLSRLGRLAGEIESDF
jgi:hypothetical protein